MKVSTHERWSAHVAAWSSSGRTCKEYAAKVGINPRTLTWWKSKLRDAAGTAAAGTPKFVEVSAEADGGLIEVEVGDTRIVLRGRVDTEALARVLAAVEGRR